MTALNTVRSVFIAPEYKMLLNLSLEGEILKYNDVLYIATYTAWIWYIQPQHSLEKSKVYKKEGGGGGYILPLMLSNLTTSLNLCCFSASKDRKRFKTWRIWTDLSEGSLFRKHHKQNWISESATSTTTTTIFHTTVTVDYSGRGWICSHWDFFRSRRCVFIIGHHCKITKSSLNYCTD